MLSVWFEKDLSLEEKWGIFADYYVFLYHRVVCWLTGCELAYWSENEYIHGTDCKRCLSGEDVMGGKYGGPLYRENAWQRMTGRY
jgi:hypothetical protein